MKDDEAAKKLQDEKKWVECEYRKNAVAVESLQEIKNFRKEKYRQPEKKKMMKRENPNEFYRVVRKIRLDGFSGRLRNECCDVEDPLED